MLVWDPISARYLPFGTLKSHAGGRDFLIPVDYLVTDVDTENAEKRQYSPRPCCASIILFF